MDENQGHAMTVDTRDGGGQFTRSIETAERDALAAHMRARSMTYQQVADELGVTKSAARKMVQRALHETLAEPAEALRQLELEKLDVWESAVMRVLEREHLMVSHGRIVSRRTDQIEQRDGADVIDIDGNPVYIWEPLADDSPVLAAADRLVKISESRRKLLGLDSPTKLAVTGAMRYELVGIEMDDV